MTREQLLQMKWFLEYSFSTRGIFLKDKYSKRLTVVNSIWFYESVIIWKNKSIFVFSLKMNHFLVIIYKKNGEVYLEDLNVLSIWRFWRFRKCKLCLRIIQWSKYSISPLWKFKKASSFHWGRIGKNGERKMFLFLQEPLLKYM